MPTRRELLLGTAAASAASAQTADAPQTTFTTDILEVIAPVTVTGDDGNFINGLEVKDFTLFDNNVAQEIKLDVSFVPISLVVAVQADSAVETMLPVIKKIGPLLEGLVIGQQGEAAIVKFDHRIIEMTDGFTNDGKLFTKALEKINPGSRSNALVDAVFHCTRMLRRRPKTQRRILLLIAETLDEGSEGRLREALLEAQINNIIIYSININRMIDKLTEKPATPRPDPFPPGSRPVPGGAPNTPNTVEQLSGYRGQLGNVVPVFVEIFKQVKYVFVPNQLEVFTRYTGGREFSFINQRTLEQVVSKIGEELHSQYLLSYRPTTKEQGGWHDIRVTIGRPNLKIRTRPGYWMASRFN